LIIRIVSRQIKFRRIKLLKITFPRIKPSNASPRDLRAAFFWLLYNPP
jgi:hypothetical protein